MTELLRDAFKKIKLYVIISDKTGRPYFNRDMEIYMFDTDYQAQDFCKAINDPVHIEGPLDFSEYRGNLFTDMYLKGIRVINLCFMINKDIIKAVIEKSDVKEIYYNEYAEQRVLCLKQWQESKYLYELQNTTYLIPIKLESREFKKCPKLKYGIVEFDNTDKRICYILFTTLQNFEEWNKTQNNKFIPLEIELSRLDEIRNYNPVCINPLTDKLYLTNDNLIKSASKRSSL